MAKKVKTAEEYAAGMDRMLTGLHTRTKTMRSNQRTTVLLWSSVLFVVAALAIWLLTVLEGGKSFVGKGVFW